jgi:AcrR family transcriptional regulator
VTVTTFQRARSEEQRGVRRRAILDTAAAMLLEMPVADLSLNELSRRVGLAKSNVLNYFESREAVLLELASAELDGWVEDLASALSDISPELPLAERTDLVVAAVVRRLALRPVLCDLISAQASVLERNVSTEVVLAYKRSAAASLMRMLEATVRALPEIGEDGATRFLAAGTLLAGALWTHSHPTAPVLAAYEADPDVAVLRMEFEPSLTDALNSLLYGLLPR